MTDLVSKSACEGLLPVMHRGIKLGEFDAGHITSIMPNQGRFKIASEALNAMHGVRFPAPGRALGKAGCRVIWTGQGQAFLLGPKPQMLLTESSAVTDQSDAWAVMLLEGGAAREVLARLCPLDLRPDVFKRGHTARSLIGHMNASITRISTQGYLVMVFRSMAVTAVHEIGDAMKSVAAQERP